MSASVTIAQLTDVHLGPIIGLRPRYWNLKRATGFANWMKNRRHAYSRELTAQIIADIAVQNADHTAVTGDLVNLGLPDEIAAAAAWLETVGPPDNVSVIPGNHDIYSHHGSDAAMKAWAPYMQGNGDAPTASVTFPYVRLIGPVALIGLNSAIPTPPFVAHGQLGSEQLRRISDVLETAGQSGHFRLVMIHHPPLPGQAPRLRGLTDASELAERFRHHGAELIIHGHNHRDMQATFETSVGNAEVIGAPSSSLSIASHHEPLGRYNLYRVERRTDGWQLTIDRRGIETPNGPIVALQRRVVYLPRKLPSE